jgi:RES domain-containing protein
VTDSRPAVPRPGRLSPAIEVLNAGSTLIRVYQRRFGPVDFNRGDAVARFRPIRDTSGAVVPTAYGAHDQETAIAEAVLRGVSALDRGSPRRRLFSLEVDGLDMARLRTNRPLRLVRLHGLGLTRLNLLREHVIDNPESEYDYTAAWAQTLYGHRSRPHGLVWTSRQNDTSRALILWGGTRVRPEWSQLEGDPLALDRGPGLDLIRQVCADAGVDFEG